MNDLVAYIEKIFGEEIKVKQLPNEEMAKLPLYLSQTFNMYKTELLGQELILAELVSIDEFSISRTEKQLQNVKAIFAGKVVLVLNNVASYVRARLTNKRINFIVPGKQLFLPEMLIDLKETNITGQLKEKKLKLLPSAQVIVLFYLLNTDKTWDIETKQFKAIAQRLAYSPMSISNAAENLKDLGLISIDGEKEKNIRFKYKKTDLWNIIEEKKLFVSPVLQTVFADEIPNQKTALGSNLSALAEYSDINPARQIYLAYEKNTFNKLKKNNVFEYLMPVDGKYAVEVWKYNPVILAKLISKETLVVDPLSLYLSMKDNQDERVEMALAQIKEKYLWSED